MGVRWEAGGLVREELWEGGEDDGKYFLGGFRQKWRMANSFLGFGREWGVEKWGET